MPDPLLTDLTMMMSNPIVEGGVAIANITDRVADTWTQRTRRLGGWWSADCDYRGTRDELDEMFLNGLLRDVQVKALGSLPVWQGFVGAMSYLRDGELWTLSIADRANAVKLIYTRLGDNLLTNGSAESGAWTVVNGATVEQSTEWVSDGTYSCKITSSSGIRGADIQASITILASTAYEARVSLRVLSGSWRVAINRVDTDAKIAAGSTRGALGDVIITLNIPDTNIFAGAVRFRITSEASAGVIYGDGAVLRLAPTRAETEWKTDADAIDRYGRIERVVLDIAMTSDAANAKAATLLTTQTWPIITPPDEYTIGATDSPDRLQLVLQGYIFTVGWRISPIAGTTTVTALIKSLIATQSDYLREGAVELNSVDYQVDDRLPLNLWTVASEAAAAGDANGARWALGCYADRRVNYSPVPTTIAYHFRGGKLYSPSGTELEPWQVEPGWMQLDDAPGNTGSLAGNGYDEIRKIYLEEIEYSIRNGLTFRRESYD